MAVVLDALQTGTSTGTYTVSWSHTIAGSNTFLTVGFAWTPDALADTGFHVASVKAGTNSLTKLTSNQTGGGVNELWYGYIPAGTYTITILYADDDPDLPSLSKPNVVRRSRSFSGVSQSAGISSAFKATGSTTPVTVDVTGTSANNYVIDSVLINQAAGITALTVGAGQTVEQNTNLGATLFRIKGSSSYETSANGTVTMSWTETINRPWATIAAEIKEFVQPVGVSQAQLLFTNA